MVDECHRLLFQIATGLLLYKNAVNEKWHSDSQKRHHIKCILPLHWT